MNVRVHVLYEKTQLLIPAFTQSVRWKRKPIWLPTAKSKLFRVPQRPSIPKEEAVEIMRLSNNYRTQMKSFIKHFTVQEYQNQMNRLQTTVIEEDDEEEFQKSVAINTEWNKKIAMRREARLDAERKKQAEMIMQKLIDKEQRDADILSRVTEEVQRAKKESSSFITAENIDQAIQEALQNTVDHNVAIDLSGNFYTGYDTSKEKESKEVSQ